MSISNPMFQYFYNSDSRQTVPSCSWPEAGVFCEAGILSPLHWTNPKLDTRISVLRSDSVRLAQSTPPGFWNGLDWRFFLDFFKFFLIFRFLIFFLNIWIFFGFILFFLGFLSKLLRLLLKVTKVPRKLLRKPLWLYCQYPFDRIHG